MSGLPDEAVEATAARLGVMYPKWHPTNRRIAAIRLLAALPAGVYVSDGEGTVRRIDTWNEMGVAWGETFSARRAALSATDTEKGE